MFHLELAPVCHVAEVGKELLLVVGERARLLGRRQHRLFRRELLVKVGHVLGAVLAHRDDYGERLGEFVLHFRSYHCGHEWRFDFPHQQLLPVDVAKKGLLLYVLGVSLAGAQATVGILAQQLQGRRKVNQRFQRQVLRLLQCSPFA